MSTPLVLLWIENPGPYRAAAARAGLADRVEWATLEPGQVPSQDVLDRCEALVAWRSGPGVLPRAKKLRWIQSLTGGMEGWLALPDLPAHLTLTCARGTHRVQMSENILGALFHLTKPYTGVTLDQREHRWTRRISDTLAGSTLGILGLGAIGQDVAKKAAALEMRVIGTKRASAPVPHVTRVLGPDQTAEVMAESDFALLLLPATAETRGLVNGQLLARMKPTAYLLNFGRGDLVVDEDLVAAVKSRTIAGAVLDVFRKEPLPPEHPFWSTEGITVLPHIGGLHPRRDDLVAALFADNLARFLDGQPLREVLDRERGY